MKQHGEHFFYGPKSFEWNVLANTFVPSIEEGEEASSLEVCGPKVFKWNVLANPFVPSEQQPVAWDDHFQSFERNVLVNPFVPDDWMEGGEDSSSIDDDVTVDSDVQQLAGVAGRPTVEWEDRVLAADGDAVRLPEGGLGVIMD